MKTRKLKLRLFGPFSATWSDGRTIDMSSSKLIALLALLATAPDGMRTRVWLQEQLWSLSGTELGRASLRRALSDLRKLFGSDFDQIFKVSNTCISLRPEGYELVGSRSDGEFLEGLAVSEPEFQKWLSQQRAHGSAAPLVPAGTPGNSFASPTVAVIPFTFLTGDGQNKILGDVLAQEMTRSLSRAKLFIVFSHLLGRQLGAPDADLRSLTSTNPIDFVIYGTVRVRRDTLEIDADIAETQSGRLCGTHAFSVSVSEFLEGKSDIIFGMTRQVAETIVMDSVEQRLSLETAGHAPSRDAAHTRRSRAEERAREICGTNLNVEDLIARQPNNSQFHGWLRRWYVEHLERSGVEAIRSRSVEKAKSYFQKALEIANDIDEANDRDRTTGRLLLLLGPQLSVNHGFASTEVQEVYDKATRHNAERIDTPQRLQMLWGLWGGEIVKAEIARAEQLGGEFLDIARNTGRPLDLSAGRYMEGVGAFYTGNFAHAESALLQAAELAKTADFVEMITSYGLDLRLLAECYLGWCHALMGRSDRTEQTVHSLKLLSARSVHVFSQALSYCFLSTMYNFMGDVAAAKRFGLRASRLSRQHGFAQQSAHARVNLGRVRDQSGHASGLALLQAGLSSYCETGAVLARPYAEAWIAEALVTRDAGRDALFTVLKARRFALKSGERYFDAELLRISALATQANRPEATRRIEKHIQLSVDQARRTGANLHLLKTLSDVEACRISHSESAQSIDAARSQC